MEERSAALLHIFKRQITKKTVDFYGGAFRIELYGTRLVVRDGLRISAATPGRNWSEWAEDDGARS